MPLRQFSWPGLPPPLPALAVAVPLAVPPVAVDIAPPLPAAPLPPVPALPLVPEFGPDPNSSALPQPPSQAGPATASTASAAAPSPNRPTKLMARAYHSGRAPASPPESDGGRRQPPRSVILRPMH